MKQNPAKQDQEPLCKTIRATRRQLELSQLEVAMYAGISQSQYSLFEHGHVQLASEVIRRIESFLTRHGS